MKDDLKQAAAVNEGTLDGNEGVSEVMPMLGLGQHCVCLGLVASCLR